MSNNVRTVNNMKKKRTRRARVNVATLLDAIKDEIDTLHEIKSPKRRAEAARDIVEYIQLHQLSGY